MQPKILEGDADAVIAGVLSWAVDPNGTKHCAITGGAGAGKTHMIKQLVDEFSLMASLGMLGEVPRSLDGYITVTSSTADSCNVLSKFLGLSKVPTLHSMFGLTVSNKKICRVHAGKKYYGENSSDMFMLASMVNHYSTYGGFYICDEANYIQDAVINLIEALDPNARIIFVGSKHQLGMGSGQSDVFNNGYTEFLLNTKWRAKNIDVQSVYDITEMDVINKTSTELPPSNALHYMDEATWLETMRNAYTSDKDLSVCTLAYSNKRVFELVKTIRGMKGLTGAWDRDSDTQCLYRGSNRKIPKNNPKVQTSNTGDFILIQGGKTQFRSYIASSMSEYAHLSNKNNQTRVRETYPTLLASTEARTINGSQGSTYDYVFLDLRDMMQSVYRYDQENFRRLRHVGMSRHTTKLFILV